MVAAQDQPGEKFLTYLCNPPEHEYPMSSDMSHPAYVLVSRVIA